MIGSVHVRAEGKASSPSLKSRTTNLLLLSLLQTAGLVRRHVGWLKDARDSAPKSLLLLFFRKEGLACLLLACALSACASTPTTLHLSLLGQSGLNPDTAGLPNPVQTHVFLLKNADSFSNTDYFQFADKEKTVLGGDLLAQHDEFMHPGQIKRLTLPIPKDTKFIGVSAAYRNIDQATWRVVTPIVGSVTILLGADALHVQDAK